MPNGVAVRQNADALSGPELRSLRNAYASAMQTPAGASSYSYWAGLHGVPGDYCWHQPVVLLSSGRPGNLFLPWHRAYLLYFELAIRDHDPSVAVPWWDYTLGNSVPAAFSEETADDQPNPLYKAHISVPNVLDPDTRRFPGEGVRTTVRLPTPEEVYALYSITDFRQFSDTLQYFHNLIHGWTGGRSQDQQVPGDMAIQDTAAYDPIFWSHHSMVDRIWYLWQMRNGVNNIPAEYLSEMLTPFRLTVRDVLDVSALGYEYAVSAASIGA